MFMDYFTYALYVIGLLFVIYVLISKRDYFIKHKKELLFFMLALLLYTQYRRYGTRLFSSPFTLSISSLPIHFCRISALMTLIYLVTRNKYVKGFVYFQSGLALLSVLFPGGLLFQLTQDWRNITYLSDHFIVALMPVVLIFIDGYQVNKKDFKISLIYSLVVPLLVLPIALTTGYNAYYVLDGVFIKDIFGDNQVVILIIMEVLLVLYNVLMYYIGIWLYTVSEKRKQNQSKLLKPVYPWVLMAIYVFGGIIIGVFYIRQVPDYLTEIPDAYVSQPTNVIADELVIYQGQSDDELMFFIESLRGKDLRVVQADGTEIPSEVITGYEGISFILDESLADQQIIIIIGDETSMETYVFSVGSFAEFQSKYESRIKYND